MPLDLYSQLEQGVVAWALTQPLIEAVIVVGSRARSDHPADEWSDLDLVVFATDAASFLNDATWLDTFGQVRAAVSNSFGKNDREWLALYDDGSKLDVAFLSIDPTATSTLQDMLDTFPYPVVLQRGARVLIDKTGAPAELRLPEISAPQPPTQAAFTALINRMLLDAIKTAKFIRRDELWRARQLCDGELKQHLLKILEWRAVTQEHDVWYDGRFMNEWADREALAALPDTFAGYYTADVQRALFATLDLFRRLTHEVAFQLDYTYPTEADHFVIKQLQSILRGNV
jgi:aminoglycoside 6-adenylyltransferase